MSFFSGIYASGTNNQRRCYVLSAGQTNTCSEFMLPPAKWFQRIGTTRSTSKSSAKPVNTGSVHDGTSGPLYRVKVAYICAWVRAYTRGFQHLVFKLGTWDSWTKKKKTNVLNDFQCWLTWDKPWDRNQYERIGKASKQIQEG